MKKLTRRAYNRKIMMFGAAIFMSIAMISTGFAAWLISSVENANATAPVTVATISDEVVKVTVDQWTLKEDSTTEYEWSGKILSFDADAADTKDAREQNEKRDVIYYSDKDGGEGEQLVLEITGTVSNSGSLNEAKPLTVEVLLPQSLADAIRLGYLATPAGYDANTRTITKDITALTDKVTTDNLKEYDASITFAWGSFFKEVNPCYFYDSDLSATQGTATVVGTQVEPADIVEAMNAFNGVLRNGLDGEGPYSGTIAITVKANQ